VNYSVYDQAVKATLETYGLNKMAARAGVNRLRELFKNPATLPQAYALANEAPKILAGRNLPHGSQLSVLGSGGEHVTQHALMPQGGTMAVKFRDPTSPMYNPIIQQNRQALVGQAIPGFAKIHEQGLTPNRLSAGGVNRPIGYSHNEFVPGPGFNPRDPAQRAAGADLTARSRTAVPGMELADTRPGNMKRHALTGEMTSFDYTPIETAHTTDPASRSPMLEHVLPVRMDTPTGRAFINPETGLREGTVTQSAFGREYMQDANRPNMYVQSPQQKRYVEQQLGRATRHYQGQLLGAAHTGRSPRAFEARAPRSAERLNQPVPPGAPAAPIAGASTSEIDRAFAGWDAPVASTALATTLAAGTRR